MGVITISLPDELVKQFKEVNNKSGLIANLLKDYFNPKIETLTATRNNLLIELENLDKQIEFTKISNNETENYERIKKQQAKEKMQDLINETIDAIQRLFIIPESLDLENLAVEFQEDTKYASLKDFMISKGFKTKDERT